MTGKAIVLSSICAVALAETSLPDDIEKVICKVATSKDIENKEVAKVCKAITTKFPAIKFQPDCPTMATAVWDKLASYCPTQELKEEVQFPGLGKLVCMLASKKQIEDRASGEVCGLVVKKFPKVPEQGCEAAVDKLWDTLEEKCPKMVGAASPIDDIEKLVCKLASKKQIEDRASGEVCKLVVKKLPSVPEQTCEVVVDKLWDTLEKKCPKMVGAASPIDDVEKLVCKLASQKEIENRETAKVCTFMKEKAPWFTFEPNCTTVVEGAWDAVVAKCPKMQQATGPAPKDVEKLICEMLSKKEIEDKETDKVCKLFKERIPFFHFEPSCKEAMEGVWDSVIAHCPKTANGVIVV